MKLKGGLNLPSGFASFTNDSGEVCWDVLQLDGTSAAESSTDSIPEPKQRHPLEVASYSGERHPTA